MAHSGPSSLTQYNATTGAQVAVLYSGFANLDGPHNPVFGPDGALYVPVWNTPDIAKFDGSSFAFLGNIVADSALSTRSIAFDAQGNILALDSNSNSVRKYSAQTGAFLGTLASFTGSAVKGTPNQIFVLPPLQPAPALGRWAALLGLLLAFGGAAAATRERLTSRAS